MHAWSRLSLEISFLDYNGRHGVLAIGHYGGLSQVPEGPRGSSRNTITVGGYKRSLIAEQFLWGIHTVLAVKRAHEEKQRFFTPVLAVKQGHEEHFWFFHTP